MSTSEKGPPPKKVISETFEDFVRVYGGDPCPDNEHEERLAVELMDYHLLETDKDGKP